MNKAELITCVAERTRLTKKDTEKTINVMLDILSERLTEGDKVNLAGFGAFETRMRAPRTQCL